MTGHDFHTCTTTACDKDCDADGQVHRFGHVDGCSYRSCSGCRQEGLDCMYEALACCKTCGCYEGSLLPVCPGRKVTMDEQDAFYAHYCAGTGPFAVATFRTVDVVRVTCYTRCFPQLSTRASSIGAEMLYDAVCELWNLINRRKASYERRQE